MSAEHTTSTANSAQGPSRGSARPGRLKAMFRAPASRNRQFAALQAGLEAPGVHLLPVPVLVGLHARPPQLQHASQCQSRSPGSPGSCQTAGVSTFAHLPRTRHARCPAPPQDVTFPEPPLFNLFRWTPRSAAMQGMPGQAGKSLGGGWEACHGRCRQPPARPAHHVRREVMQGGWQGCNQKARRATNWGLVRAERNAGEHGREVGRQRGRAGGRLGFGLESAGDAPGRG